MNIKLEAGIFAVLCLSSGCPPVQTFIMEISQGRVKEELMEYNDAQFLAKQFGIDDDCAEGLADELHSVGASQIIEIELIPCKYGYQGRLTDDAGNTYFVVLGGLGYLELIRAGSPDGEVLYAAID